MHADALIMINKKENRVSVRLPFGSRADPVCDV